MTSSPLAVGRYFAALLVAVGVLSGCSGVRPYPNSLEKNAVIRTEADSGSIFSKVSAAVDIFSVTADCRTEYLGTVDLKGPAVEVSIPPDQLSYLVFVFSNSSFFGSSRSTISHETLLEARPGHHYDISVSYIDDIYNVAINDQDPRNPDGRKIAVRDMSACKAL